MISSDRALQRLGRRRVRSTYLSRANVTRRVALRPGFGTEGRDARQRTRRDADGAKKMPVKRLWLVAEASTALELDPALAGQRRVAASSDQPTSNLWLD